MKLHGLVSWASLISSRKRKSKAIRSTPFRNGASLYQNGLSELNHSTISQGCGQRALYESSRGLHGGLERQGMTCACTNGVCILTHYPDYSHGHCTILRASSFRGDRAVEQSE